MTVVQMNKRLSALEARGAARGASLDHLTDAELEAMLELVRADLLTQLEANGVVLPPEWAAMTEAQQDLWVTERVKELGANGGGRNEP